MPATRKRIAAASAGSRGCGRQNRSSPLQIRRRLEPFRPLSSDVTTTVYSPAEGHVSPTRSGADHRDRAQLEETGRFAGVVEQEIVVPNVKRIGAVVGEESIDR